MSSFRLLQLQGARSLQARTALRSSICQQPHIRLVSRPAISDTRHQLDLRPFASKNHPRFHSSSSSNHPIARRQPPKGPPPSVGAIFSAALRSTAESLKNLFRPEVLRDAYRKNPGEMILALAILAATAGCGLYAVYLYFNYFYHRQFTRYPDPVAKAMRRALYYSNYSPDPQRALKYYKQALDLCEELGLDRFSDDVMGIRIQLAQWLEQIENYNSAAKVLEVLLSDCKRWVEVMEKAVKEGTAPKLAPADGLKTNPDVKPEDLPAAETLWGKRTRILGKAVGISVKLGELYANEHLMEQDLAHDRLIWSVETALNEARRRAAEGLKEGEGEWMSPESIGGALESLAHSYESRSQFHLAVPLFLQALRLCKEPCHSAVIMNNLAASFAQHPTQAPFQTVATAALIEGLPSGTAVSAEETRKAFLETAKRWAGNANAHATQPQGDQRTPECDQACAVSLCNLGDISALLGNSDEARHWFQRSIEMSKSLGFDAGVKQAQAGLKSLPATAKSKPASQ